jgi:hypothetical protein
MRLRDDLPQAKEEDAGVSSPVKDDDEGLRLISRKRATLFNRLDYIIPQGHKK